MSKSCFYKITTRETECALCGLVYNRPPTKKSNRIEVECVVINGRHIVNRCCGHWFSSDVKAIIDEGRARANKTARP